MILKLISACSEVRWLIVDHITASKLFIINYSIYKERKSSFMKESGWHLHINASNINNGQTWHQVQSDRMHRWWCTFKNSVFCQKLITWTQLWYNVKPTQLSDYEQESWSFILQQYRPWERMQNISGWKGCSWDKPPSWTAVYYTSIFMEIIKAPKFRHGLGMS